MTEDTSKPKEAIYGVCATYFTGSSWFCGVQDINFITPNVAKGYCKRCGKRLHGGDDNKILELMRVHFPNAAGGFSPRPDCADNVHEEEVGDEYDICGLHALKNGDKLTIYSKRDPSAIVWSGAIRFGKDFLCPEGVDPELWEEWFSDNYRAILIPAPKE